MFSIPGGIGYEVPARVARSVNVGDIGVACLRQFYHRDQGTGIMEAHQRVGATMKIKTA